MREPSPIDGHFRAHTEPERLADRYLLGEELGVGATARVYQAWDETLKVSRAVKLLSVPDAYRQALRERLRTEARIMARLNHPHVLRIYDICTLADDDFVVMELAEGGSLQALVDAEGALPIELACDYILQILSALGAAHRAGVVHRDVKPQNILLNAEGQALLADFGIALLEEADRHTRTGAAMGSLSYMAPEQRVDARQVRPTADIYATGATLYHLLTAANPIDLFASPLFSPRWQALPAHLRPVVQRATAHDPLQRYPSAEAMALALRAALLSESDAESTDGMGMYRPPLDEDRTLPPDAYTDLSRDPSTLFDIPHPSLLRVMQEHREALAALPLTLGALWVGLACWFLAPSSFRPQSAQAPAAILDIPSVPRAVALPIAAPASPEGTAAPQPVLSSRGRGERVVETVRHPPPAPGPDLSQTGLPLASALTNGKVRELVASSPPEGVEGAWAGVSAAGRWQGRLGGRLVEVSLTETAAATLEGALRSADSESSGVLADVQARYDGGRRTLQVQLRFPDLWPAVSEGELRLSADGGTLSGRVLVDGQVRSLRLQRSLASFR